MEVGASEETPGETVLNAGLNGAGFSVAFDPLVRPSPVALRHHSELGVRSPRQ